jgi:hypothetical protein
MNKCHICLEADGPFDCISCHKFYCEAHASPYERTLCAVCVNFENTKVISSPLVDDENVTHQGRKLLLTGESWMRNRDIIATMTDVELEAKLVALSEAVKEAEMVLDYRKIVRNMVENEKGTRYSKKMSRLRLIKGVGAMHEVGKANGQTGAAQTTKDALGALKKMGLKPEAIANLLTKLARTKKAP